MWRDTGFKPKFFFVDARALVGMSVFALHWSFFTFYISLGIVLFFFLLSYMGFSPKSFMLYLRTLIFGKIRPSRDEFYSLRRSHK